MRVVSGPESSRGGWGRTARLPVRFGPSPENTTSRSGCSASERTACESARLNTSAGVSLWDIARVHSAREAAGETDYLRASLTASVFGSLVTKVLGPSNFITSSALRVLSSNVSRPPCSDQAAIGLSLHGAAHWPGVTLPALPNRLAVKVNSHSTAPPAPLRRKGPVIRSRADSTWGARLDSRRQILFSAVLASYGAPGCGEKVTTRCWCESENTMAPPWGSRLQAAISFNGGKPRRQASGTRIS